MNEHDIAEQAYKNGYEQGKRDAVKHGRWIRYEDIQENSVKYICSNCGDYHAFRNDGGSPFLTSEHTFNENFIYCRKCGCKNGW